MKWSPRLAREGDIPALEALITLSVRTLQAPFYSPAQMDAAMGPVFGVDRQLIRDGTYFVVEHEGQIVGCGGWSRRKLFSEVMARGPGKTMRSTRHAMPRASARFLCIRNWRDRASGAASWRNARRRSAPRNSARSISWQRFRESRFTRPLVTTLWNDTRFPWQAK